MTRRDTDAVIETDPWSVTRDGLFARLRSLLEADESAVVATIVDVEGSAYRRPGARMVVPEDGDSAGAITAGCLEDPVIELAREVAESGRPRIETFDLMDDGGEWGLGLGCRGIIDVLLEPVDEGWRRILSAYDRDREVATLTAVESTDPDVGVGDRTVLVPEEEVTHADGTDAEESDPDGSDAEESDPDGSDADGPVGESASDRSPLPQSVVDELQGTVAELREGTDSGTVAVDTDGGTVTVFVDWIAPPPTLLLFGNQNDVHPVAKVGRQAGFRVAVASARGARSDPEQYPNADRVETVRPPEIDGAIEDPERTYAVLMSHNLVDDRLALETLLDTEVPYLGLLGPRERFEELRESVDLTEADRERISTPVGLDLGGGEPIHIAMSIVSEALAVHNGRDGGRLTEKEGPIHARVEPNP